MQWFIELMSELSLDDDNFAKITRMHAWTKQHMLPMS